jgi:hypothetical protein
VDGLYVLANEGINTLSLPIRVGSMLDLTIPTYGPGSSLAPVELLPGKLGVAVSPLKKGVNPII